MATRIGFSTSKTSWVSKIIRWFTDGRASHCFFIYRDTDWNRDMVLESTQGGYKTTPFENYKSSLIAEFTPKYDIEVGLAKSIDWLGEGYDYKGLFGMAWVELGRWLRRKWVNPWRGADTMFCSEAVARVLIESRYPGTKGWDPQSIDPEMLQRFFEKESGS